MTQADSARTTESSLAKLTRHSRWLFAARVITGSASLIQAMILARCLGANSYGVYVLVLAFVNSINTLFNSRVWQAVVRFVPEFLASGRKDKAAGVIQLCIAIELLATVIASITIFLSYSYVTACIPGSSGRLVFLAAIAPFLAVLTEPLRAIVRVAEKYKWLTVQSAVIAVINTVLLLLVWKLGLSIESILVTYLIQTALTTAGLIAAATVAARDLRISFWTVPRPGIQSQDLRRIMRFIFLTNLSVSASFVNSADRLLLSLFVSPASVGAYDLARRIVGQLDGLAAPVNRVAFQEMSGLIAAGQFDRVRDIQRSLTRRMTVVVIPLGIAVTLLAPTGIPLIFGGEFAASGAVLQILIWQLLRLPMRWFRGYMLCIDRVATMTVTTLLLAILLPAFMLLLIPPFGILGAAWANTIWAVVWLAVMAGLYSHTKSMVTPAQDADRRPSITRTLQRAA